MTSKPQISLPSTSILAGGSCPSPQKNTRMLAKKDQVESLKIIIDGTRLMDRKNHTSLLGDTHDFLPASLTFQLTRFEPLEDGRCIAHYTRTQQ